MEKLESKLSNVSVGIHGERLKDSVNPDLVKYQYSNQLESQKEIFTGVIRYNLAHVVMMHEQGVFSREDSVKLLNGLKEIESLGVEKFPFDPKYIGVNPSVEADLVRRFGYEVGGRLTTGRARGDIHNTGGRLVVRDRLLQVLDNVIDVREVFLKLAEQHKDTIMPAYTWFQSAQPTTLAHDLLHLAEGFELNFWRLKNTFRVVNLGICESGVGCGTEYPINRERVAELLGFEGLVESTKLCHREFGGGEVFLLGDLAVLMGYLFRITSDLYPKLSQEYGYFEFGDEWSGTSTSMPQKKNPSLLKAFRTKAIKAIGELTTGFLAYFTSSSDMLGEIADLPEMTSSVMRDNVIPALMMMKGALPTLRVNKDLARERSGAFYSQAPNVANAMVREKNLSFRTAHRIVGTLVREAVKEKIKPSDITPEMLDKAAVEIQGHPVHLDAKVLRDALDPVAIVKSRKGTGSTGSDMINKAIENRRACIREDREWLVRKKAFLAEAEGKLRDAVDSVIG